MQACKILLFLSAVSLAQASLSADHKYSATTVGEALDSNIGKEILEEFFVYEKNHIEQIATSAKFLGVTANASFSQKAFIKFIEANSPGGKELTPFEAFKRPKYSDWKAQVKEHFGLSDDDATDDQLAPLFKDIIKNVEELNTLFTGYLFARLIPREADPQESHMNLSGAGMFRVLGAVLDQGAPAVIKEKMDDLLDNAEKGLKEALGVEQEDNKIPKNPTMPGDRTFQKDECSLM